MSVSAIWREPPAPARTQPRESSVRARQCALVISGRALDASMIEAWVILAPFEGGGETHQLDALGLEEELLVGLHLERGAQRVEEILDEMATDAAIGSLREIRVEFQGKDYTFFVSGEQTVLDLKIMIEERVSIPSGEQKLEFSGQMTYGDSATMQACGIEVGSQVKLTVKGCGGNLVDSVG